MKKTLLSTIAVLALTACSGGSDNSGNETITPIAQTGEQAGKETTVRPQQVTIEGDIDHKEYKPGAESTVTFQHFPKNVAEFEAAMNQLGGEPQGAVVLQLMAMELFRNDSVAGRQCIEKINTEVNVPSVMRRLPDILRRNDSYSRPYLVATFMQGATPQNGYNPPSPYKVKVRTHPVHSYERSEMLKGYVIYLQVESSGYDTSWRGVEVVKQKGDDHYRVSNCPSLYTQCKEIDWETDEEFQGLE